MRLVAIAIGVSVVGGVAVLGPTGSDRALASDAPKAERASTPKVARVSLFKNGVGYFSSEIVLPDEQRSLTLGQLPVPSLGTFWVGGGPAVRLRGVFTRMDDTGEPVPAADFVQLLAANVGRRVQIRAGSEVVQGRVLSAGRPDAREEPESPYLMGARRASMPMAVAVPSGSALVSLQTDAGLAVMSAASITRVDLEDAKPAVALPRLRRPTMRLELEQAAPGETVRISYLARGIGWSPSYQIDLSDPRIARLTAAAVVVNEVVDLDGVRLDLVTGFPNAAFADVRSPIAMSQTLAEFLEGLRQDGEGRAGRHGGRQAVVMQQAIVSNAFQLDDDAALIASLAPSAGEQAEDLFLYPVERLSLRRGETVQLPLFAAEAPYEHLYTWEIGDDLDETGRYQRDERPRPEEVWHSCRLTNPLRMPLTTAPAQFVNAGRFTGQDVLHYTAPGAQTTVRINRAMSLLARQAEVELDRKRDAVRFHGSAYDLVTIRGELRLRNRMETKARVEVTKQLSGEVSETVPAAKDTKTAKGLRQVNTRHALTWTLDVLPSEEKTLSYTYAVYVNN